MVGDMLHLPWHVEQSAGSCVSIVNSQGDVVCARMRYNNTEGVEDSPDVSGDREVLEAICERMNAPLPPSSQPIPGDWPANLRLTPGGGWRSDDGTMYLRGFDGEYIIYRRAT